MVKGNGWYYRKEGNRYIVIFLYNGNEDFVMNTTFDNEIEARIQTDRLNTVLQEAKKKNKGR